MVRRLGAYQIPQWRCLLVSEIQMSGFRGEVRAGGLAKCINTDIFPFDYAYIYLNTIAEGLRVYILMLIKIVASRGFELGARSTGVLAFL